jgi:hypothetical protein
MSHSAVSNSEGFKKLSKSCQQLSKSCKKAAKRLPKSCPFYWKFREIAWKNQLGIPRISNLMVSNAMQIIHSVIGVPGK